MTVSPKVRTYIYGVVTSALPVLITYGMVTQTQASLWLTFAGAVLGLGASATAVANRPTKTDGSWLPGEAEVTLAQMKADDALGTAAGAGEIGPPADKTAAAEES